ncbi:MAG TPA: hypothetical protein VKW78_17130 [Terriglobales bacterium]|nr:hypothetical protein [Terriglobales bacterium]
MRLSNIVSRYLREIATAWPEFQFATHDGRVFACIDDSINSILFRIQARGHVPALWERVALRKVRGAIIEVDTYDPPMVFEDRLEMLQAWMQLHDMFQVELTEEEWDAFLGTSGTVEEQEGDPSSPVEPDPGSEATC